LIACICTKGGREVRGIDAYGVLVAKGYIAHAP